MASLFRARLTAHGFFLSLTAHGASSRGGIFAFIFYCFLHKAQGSRLMASLFRSWPTAHGIFISLMAQGTTHKAHAVFLFSAHGSWRKAHGVFT
jgi:hypothetical protein